MDNSSLSVFNFQSKEVRVVLINDELWFVAKDVCEILELEQVSRACDRLREKDRGVTLITTPSGDQQMVIISEFGLYELVLSSRKKEAKQFKYWLCDEVIPSIRKTGGYVKPMSPAEIIIAQGQAMLAMEKRQTEMEAELAMIRHIVEANELETQANTAELERFRNGHGYYFSIAGFCSLKGLKPSLEWMKQQGRKASAICKIKGINPVPVTDPRWGMVNTYPDMVLVEMDWSSCQ